MPVASADMVRLSAPFMIHGPTILHHTRPGAARAQRQIAHSTWPWRHITIKNIMLQIAVSHMSPTGMQRAGPLYLMVQAMAHPGGGP